MAVQQESFEAVWPALSGRLKRVLQSRRVPEECVDDVIQETGLRLLRHWKTVDQSTIWSLTLTVAGNIIKDDMRRRARDERFAESLPVNTYVDIEERALARVELWKTHRAIDALSAVQRTALLTDVYGFESAVSHNSGTAKMSRLRARRRLRQTLGRASGLVALGSHRLRRFMFGDPRGGLGESASQTVAAALLIAAGVDLVLLGGGIFHSRTPSEIGRVAINAPFQMDRTATATGSDARSVGAADPFLTGRSAHGTTRSDGASEVDEVLTHNESVGTNGASSSIQSSLGGQRTTLDLSARRSTERCQGEMRIATPCVGTISVEVLAHHNGKTYGVRASSNGDVSVEDPHDLGGG